MAHDIVIRPKAKDSGTVDARTLLYFLRAHQGLILLCLFFGAVVAAACMTWMPRRYTAHAVLEVVTATQPIADLRQPDPANDASSASLLKTVEQSVAGPSVLRRVIATMHLATDPEFMPHGVPASETEQIDLLSRCISVNLIRGTRLISVEAVGTTPERARALAQAVVDEFFAQNLDNRRDESGSTRTFLTGEAQRLADRLKTSERALQAYREQYGAIAPGDREAIDVERLRHLHEMLSNATGARLALESERAQVAAALEGNDLDRLLELRSIAADPDVIELRKQLADQNAQVASLAMRYRAKHPVMMQALRQQDAMRQALDSAARSVAQSILRSYQVAQSTETGLKQELAKQEQHAVDVDRVAIPYRALEREVESDTAIYRQLLARLKETDVIQSLAAGRSLSGSYVQLTEKPITPDRPSSPKLKFVVPAALGAGLFLGLGLALVRRALDDSLPSVDEAEACLGVSTLAVVPYSNQLGFRRGRARAPQPGVPEVEAFRSLRTSLSLRQDQGDGRAVMFTSALPGEGKSCCSSNYAVVVAQSGLRTLLIDGDLRRPRLRYAFNRYTDRPGLAECLVNPALVPSAIETTSTRNLFLLGNSLGTPHAAELLAGGNLPAVLADALSRFDRVIVDTAPVAVVSDALYFARHIPTVCLVVRAQRTPRRFVHRAGRLLSEIGGRPVTGVVLNQIRRDGAASYHYYYHGGRYDTPLLPASS